MRKKYNTPHRRHVVKTRMTDEEYADFTGRLAAYEISLAASFGSFSPVMVSISVSFTFR